LAFVTLKKLLWKVHGKMPKNPEMGILSIICNVLTKKHYCEY